MLYDSAPPHFSAASNDDIMLMQLKITQMLGKLY